MTLTEFLLARLSEDEEAARDALTDPVCAWNEQDWIEIDPTSLTHVRRHDPARVLAECEAKRRIVDEHAPHQGYDDPFTFCLTCEAGASERKHRYPCTTLRLLALPHADHPDHDEAWRP